MKRKFSSIFLFVISLFFVFNFCIKNRNCFCRFDYNRIELKPTQVLLYNPVEIKCPLQPENSDQTDIRQPMSRGDGIMLIFWFKGLDSKAPFLTIDTRDVYNRFTSAISRGPVEHLIISPSSFLMSQNFSKSKRDENQALFQNVSRSFQTNGVTNSFIQRATYRIDHHQQVAYLQVQRVEDEDEGIYRCRVDFRHSRTTNSFTLLEIIVPPSKVFIRDQNGSLASAHKGLLGPYFEGQYIELTCETTQAKPLPKVLWYEGSTLVDDSYEQVIESKTMVINETALNETRFQNYLYKPSLRARNRFKLLRPLERKDLFKEFRCMAMNNALIEPVSSTVRIDMILPPINVEIVLSYKEIFYQGRSARILCQSEGSRPVAQLHWFRRNQRILSQIEDYYDIEKNISKSIMEFVPTDKDDGTEISCKAINIRLPLEKSIYDIKKINVQYVPILNVKMIYPTRIPNFFPENSAIRLECNIRANPYPTKPIHWYFNNTLIGENNKEFMIIEHDYLAIDFLKYNVHHGYYKCLAENSQGRNKSNPFFIEVSYAPRCRDSKIYAISLNKTAEIICDVDARPSLIYFNWFYNATPINSLKYTTRGSQSILFYTPRSRDDYGELSCQAQNAVGKMSQPCVYKLIPFGKPEPIRKCLLMKVERQPMMKCHYEFNGGLETNCEIKIFRSNDSVLVWNSTDNPKLSHQNDFCVFYPINFTSENQVKINVNSYNQQGSSKPYSFYTTFPDLPLSSLVGLNHLSYNKSDEMNGIQSFSYYRKVYLKAEEIFFYLTENGNWVFLVVFLMFGILIGYLIRTVSRIQELSKYRATETINIEEIVDHCDTLQTFSYDPQSVLLQTNSAILLDTIETVFDNMEHNETPSPRHIRRQVRFDAEQSDDYRPNGHCQMVDCPNFEYLNGTVTFV